VKRIETSRKKRAGQALIEYTLLMCFVVMAVFALLGSTGASVNPIWNKSSGILGNAAASAS